MTGDQDEDIAFDIGVGQRASSGKARRSSERSGRRLPIWAVALAAVLVGWILGTLMSGSSGNEPVAQEPQPTTQRSGAATFPPPNPPVALPDEGPVEAVYEQTNGSGPVASLRALEDIGDAPTVVFAAPQPAGFGVPSALNVSNGGRVMSYAVDTEIAGPTQTAVGRVDHRLLAVGDRVLFIAADSVLLLDVGEQRFPRTGPVDIAEAAFLLKGSESGHAWAVGADGLSVLDIDVGAERVRATYDLTNIGTPLASYAGGLVVDPVNARLGQFALWSPRRGIEKLWSIDDQTFFIDAADNTIVVQTPRGIASYNAVTGALTQIDATLTKREEAKAFVSPDGARLAVVQRESVSTLPNVIVIDLQTGETIDTFETASESQLHWVSAREIVSISPRVRPAQVVLRDTSATRSTRVLELAGPAYWVTVIDQ